MKRIAIWTMLLVLAGTIVFWAGHLRASSDWPGLAPEPQLLSPVGEVVDLSGKKTLEFKWSPFVGRMWERQHYDFRLYKGRERVEGTQIVVKKIPRDQYSVMIDVSVFEAGQSYAWGLKQVYMDRKSEEAYSSFEVKKGPVSGCPV